MLSAFPSRSQENRRRILEVVFLVMLGTSSFSARNEALSCFTMVLVPSWERARTQDHQKYELRL